MYKIMLNGQTYVFEDEELGRAAGLAHEIDATMVDTLPNPSGAGYFDLISYGGTNISIPILSSVVGNTPLGTLMEVVTPYTGPGTAAIGVHATVQPSSTTADNLLVGPIVGGQGASSGNSTSIPPGGVAVMKSFGLCQILCDATTTAGSALVQSAATAGAAKNAAAVTNQTIGTALQAVTIASGTKLVWALVKMT